MKLKNKLGIWMNHSIAHLMDSSSDAFEVQTIESKFTQQKKMQALAKSESFMLAKEKQELSSYYKKISEIIKNYKRVILFGSTNAKFELFDILSEDEQFIKIKIEIKNTDKMTLSQKNSLVMELFFKGKD